MSTPQERLDEVYLAYSNAYLRRFVDLKEAGSQQQAKDILTNVHNLEATYLKAATDALGASSAAIESAYQDAQKARIAIDDAYNAAVAIVEKIRLVGAGAKVVGELVKKAQSCLRSRSAQHLPGLAIATSCWGLIRTGESAGARISSDG